MVNELQRFPILRKRMDEVIGNFLREGLEPSETMIGHIIEMEVYVEPLADLLYTSLCINRIMYKSYVCVCIHMLSSLFVCVIK